MMLTLLYALAFAAGLFFVVASVITLATIRRLRLVPPETVGLSPLDVPEDARSLLAPGLKHLLALGFTRPAAVRQVSQRVGGQPLPQHALVLPHANVPAIGYVVQLTAPDRTRHYSIFFVGRTRDGHTLLTRNRSSVVGQPLLPDLTLLDLWLPNWPALWRAHRDKMRAIQPDAGQWATLPADQWIRLGADFESASFNRRVTRGDLVQAGDGSYRFSLGCALVMLARAWSVWVPSMRAMDEDKAAPTDEAPATATGADPMLGQIETYERETRDRHTARWSRGATWLLFLVTAAVAAVSFGLSMDLGTLVALLAVLLFHELGHFAAMRWAGYKDLKIFFLPFIGAAVTGRHEQPTMWEELIVLFAGPVPGLVIGLGALLGWPADSPMPEWVRNCALLAVVINAFNLLPIHPLDGGKIFEILLLSRWPWIAFAGRVAGLLALAGIALMIDDTFGRIAMLGLVLLLALGLGHQLREARMASALRAAGQWGGMTRQEALQALFGAIGRLGYASRPWPTQRALVDAVLPAVMRPRLPHTARVSGLAVYGFFLTLPVLAALAYLWNIVPAAVQKSIPPASESQRPDDAVMARYAAQRNAELQELRARIAATADAARRWELLEAELELVAGELATNRPGELPAGEALLADAQALAPTLPDPLARQATVAIWKAEAATEPSVRLQHLQSAMALYDAPQAGAADPGPFVQATALWLFQATREDRQARSARIDKAVALAGERPGLHGAETVLAFKLDDLLAQGKPTAALELARGWFEQALRLGDGLAIVTTAQSYVDVMLVNAGPGQALQLLGQLLAQLESIPTERAASTDGLRRHGMWLAEAAGRTDWQREQVQRLPVPGALGTDASLATRALLWLVSGRQDPVPTILDVERAHWQGDEEGARRAARRLLQRRPGFAVTLPPGSDTLPTLGAARAQLLHDMRKAVYERYGLTVRPVS